MRTNVTTAIVYICECLLTKETDIRIAIGRYQIEIVRCIHWYIRHIHRIRLNCIGSAARYNRCLICSGHLCVQCIIQLSRCFNHLKRERKYGLTGN